MTTAALSPRQCATWAESRPISGPMRIVLDVIARRVDWSGPNPGSAALFVATIADRARMSVRSVQRHVARLIGLGELERVETCYPSGVQHLNIWRVPGLIALASGPAAETAQPPRKSRKILSGRGDGTATPYIPNSPDSSKHPPAPETAAEPRMARRGEESREDRERLGGEALAAFDAAAAPTWDRPAAAQTGPALRLWLGRRVQRLGGLEAWRDLLARALTSRWMTAERPAAEKFGVAFFSAPRTVEAIRAGAYGVTPPAPPPGQSAGVAPELLAAQPWLAYRSTDAEARARVSSAEFERGLSEARAHGKIFGRAQESYALWRALQPAAYAAWKKNRGG